MTEPHPPDEHWVAQEGAFSAATSSVPVLHYYPARGRAEPIRLTLALVRQPWFEPPAAPVHALVRHQLDSYPFRQLPRFVDELNARVDLVQSMAILRHLGRKYKLYGSGDLEDAAAVDMVLEAVTELREKLKAVWVVGGLDPAGMARYASTVLAPEAELLASNEPGPGLACLERLLAGPPSTEAKAGAGMQGSGSSSAAEGGGRGAAAAAVDDVDDDEREAGALMGDDGDDFGESDGRMWMVGERISIADIAVADLVDMHFVHFEQQVKSNFPHLCMHRKRVMGQPGIKDYLASNNRHNLIWGVEWIEEHNQTSKEGSS